jgi:hypothetical protein
MCEPAECCQNSRSIPLQYSESLGMAMTKTVKNLKRFMT